MLVAVVALLIVIWLLPFAAIERVFGYGGLLLFVFVAAALKQGPDWSSVGAGFVPEAKGSSLYCYFVVGLIAAALMPYEVYFYSSGAVEERWGPKDLTVNRLNVGEPLHVAALLTGHGVYPSRLPRRLQRLGRRLFGPGILGRTIMRVPWTAVEDVEVTVRLREPAAEIGLAAIDRERQRWVRRLPGAG